MKQLANLDLYKGVIIASLLLLPLCGWWIRSTSKAIEAARDAGRKYISIASQILSGEC